MKSEPSLVAEDIQRVAMHVTSGRRIILPLIKEGPGLLPFTHVEVKANPVHGEDRVRLLTLNQLGLACGKLFKLPDVRFDSLGDRSWPQALREFLDEGGPNRLPIHSLRQDLHRQDVVVSVYDDSGEKIGFAEDYPVGIRLADKRRAIVNGRPNPLANQGREVLHRRMRDHPDGNL